MEDKKSKIFFILVILLIIIISLAILIPKFPIFIVKKTFNYAVYRIVNISGLSQWLVKGILVFALMPFYWALLEISKFDILIFKRKKRHKKAAKFIILSYTGLFFLSMFFLSRDTYFQHYDGTPIKYYAVTPEGIRFFDSPGYDPKYGIKLKPVTPEMMQIYQKQRLGLQPRKIEVQSIEDVEFFDPISGEPKLWYYINEEGNYEFYDKPGVHPITKEELKPVSPEIVKAYAKKLREKHLSMYINTALINYTETKEISVLIIDELSKETHIIEQIISSIIKSRGLNLYLNLFKDSFIKQGMFAEIFSGDTSKIKEFQLEKHTDYVILGKKASSFRINQELQDLVSADLVLELKLFDAVNGKMVDSISLKTIGAGFSNDEAEKRAIEHLYKRIEEFLKII